MKQTAVEFLLEKYKSQSGLLFSEDFEQAKAMEKKEKSKEYLRGFEDGEKYMKITYNL